mmetsp:Transcript_2662/g.6261  ORF Transcript_2662/g.6261 Transcript_2662/m.6261 type:complete len:352 (+) Transcript_2662:66-1121(+)
MELPPALSSHFIRHYGGARGEGWQAAHALRGEQEQQPGGGGGGELAGGAAWGAAAGRRGADRHQSLLRAQSGSLVLGEEVPLDLQRVLGDGVGAAQRGRGSALDELRHKVLQLLHADVGHDHHVGDLALAGELPLAHKRRVLRPLKDDGRAEGVKHRLDARRLQHRLEDMGVAETLFHVFAHALVPLFGQGVPHVDGGVAVARAHDGRVTAVEVLHVGGEGHDVPLPRHDHAAWHGGSDELVARDRDAPDGLLESHHRRRLDKGDHEAKEGPVAVYVEAILRVACPMQYVQDTVEVIDCTLDSGPNVHVEDGRPAKVCFELFFEHIIVDLTGWQRLNLYKIHPVHPSSLCN